MRPQTMKSENAERVVEKFEQGQICRRQLTSRLMGLGAARAIAPHTVHAGQEGGSTGLDHVALTVRDVRRFAEFYRRHLGLEVIRSVCVSDPTQFSNTKRHFRLESRR